MNTKTRYLLPAFAAVFALMFVAATPYVIAELGTEKDAWHDGKKNMWKDGAKHHKKHMTIKVEGFVGSIPIPEDMDREDHKALKDQVTVSLSEAANGLDVMKGSIGIAVNENGEKFVVWKLVSMDKDEGSDTMTATIYVVDAADTTNTATVTKEFDSSIKDRKYSHGEGYDKERHAEKIEKLEQKLTEPTGDAELDAVRAQFLVLIQELREAHENADSDRAQEISDDLKELRSQLGDVRKF